MRPAWINTDKHSTENNNAAKMEKQNKKKKRNPWYQVGRVGRRRHHVSGGGGPGPHGQRRGWPQEAMQLDALKVDGVDDALQPHLELGGALVEELVVGRGKQGAGAARGGYLCARDEQRKKRERARENERLG